MTPTKNSSEIYKPVLIKSIHEEIENFKTFMFQDGHGINYKPGQYLTLVQNFNEEELRRSYSITSSPALNEPLSIGIKRAENGFFSRLLIDTAKEGDELITTGAGGFFTLPEDIQNFRQVFFFAVGSGITPVYSLIKTLLFLHPHIHVVLIYSNASPSKTIFLQSLLQLKENFSNRLQIEFLFSNNPDLAKARLNRDLLLMLVGQFSITSSSQILFYICGPEAYMRQCMYVLQESGVEKESIRKENFIFQTAPKIKVNPPDKEDRCGNCAAKCIKGKIWHSYNEVLTEKDLENGLVLTCVGHPVGGDMELEIS